MAKQFILKFKEDQIAFAHNLNDQLEVIVFGAKELPFKLTGKKEVDTVAKIANCYYVTQEVLRLAQEQLAQDNKTIIQIALPGEIAALLNNIEIMTRTVWSGKKIYDKHFDAKTKRTTLNFLPVLKQTPLHPTQKAYYRNLLLGMRTLIGFAWVRDTQFVCRTADNAKTEDDKMWVALNELCNTELGIGSGMANPLVANDNSTALNPLIASMGISSDDDDDLPW